MQINDLIAKVKECMVYDPETAIAMLRGRPEVEAAGLDDLVWSLDSRRWGCCTNDVRGIVELLERHLITHEADFAPYFEWTCPACGMRLPSTQTHCPNDHEASGLY